MPAVKITLWVVLLAYLMLLSKAILFKNSPGYYKRYFKTEYRHFNVKDGWRKANTTPFSTIQLFYNSRRMNADYRKDNLVGNFLGFLPFGFLLPLLLPWFRNLFLTMIGGFLLSLSYEMAQLIFGLGVFDVDDLILNTAGCVAGFICFWITQKLRAPQPGKRVTA